MASYSILVVENGGGKISDYLEERVEKLTHLSLRILRASDETEMNALLERERVSILVIDKGPVSDFLDLLNGSGAAGKERMVFVLSRTRSDFQCCLKEFNFSRVVLTNSLESLKEIFDKVNEALLRGCSCRT